MKRSIKTVVLLIFFILLIPMTTDAASGSWKKDSGGWWYQYQNGGYARGWVNIDNSYYYFTSNGYMAYSEYREGCWLNSNGTWSTNNYNGHWEHDTKGWWYTDSSGWYPKGQWLWIDGKCYYFKADGYLAINEYIGTDYVGSDGAYVTSSGSSGDTSSSDDTNKGLSGGSLEKNKNDYSGFNGSSTVYVSRKGKIHKNSNCGGMKKYTTMTYDEALSKGYSKCGTCFK